MLKLGFNSTSHTRRLTSATDFVEPPEFCHSMISSVDLFLWIAFVSEEAVELDVASCSRVVVGMVAKLLAGTEASGLKEGRWRYSHRRPNELVAVLK